MEAMLISFLAPVLPYLLKKAEGGAERAIDAVGAEAWERAQALWGKLRPGVEGKEGAREAVEALAENPDDEVARGALEFQLRTLLKADSELGVELGRMLAEAQQAGAVVIQGGIRADRGAVIGGRDIRVEQGGLHTGRKEGERE
jgi:hypothetical protein